MLLFMVKPEKVPVIRQHITDPITVQLLSTLEKDYDDIRKIAPNAPEAVDSGAFKSIQDIQRHQAALRTTFPPTCTSNACKQLLIYIVYVNTYLFSQTIWEEMMERVDESTISDCCEQSYILSANQLGKIYKTNAAISQSTTATLSPDFDMLEMFC